VALIVLTHGLGASRGHWGSTVHSLRHHDDLASHEIRIWTYPTSKAPFFLKHLRLWRYESLRTIGERLWSDLRSWSEEHETLVLLGHSMGGLVTAAALVHGFTNSEDRDLELRNKLRGLICIATPFAGASHATMIHHFYRTLGINRHIASLRPKSRERTAVVRAFAGPVLNHAHLAFVIMKAGNDGVVQPVEITSPFSREQYEMEVLAGAHSECITNLGPDDPNLLTLITTLKRILNPTASTNDHTIQLFKSRSVTIRSHYEDRLSRMTDRLDILAWGLASFREDYGPEELEEWISRGIRVRILLVNPNSHTGVTLCELQDRLEHRVIGSTAEDSTLFLDSRRSYNGIIEVRVSDFHPGVNIFRIDGDMFFGPYLAGTVSRNMPTWLVSDQHWLFDKLSDHFDWMWERASDGSDVPGLP